MRLRRLDLIRYGRFKDYKLDFGEHTLGNPDLHLIYVPDEASKPAVLGAWLDLLYGMGAIGSTGSIGGGGAQRPPLRVAAALQLGDGLHELLRTKTENTLLDALGRPADERALRSDLNGMSREAYRTLFALDEGTLAQGGESILDAGGELGQLLFSASSGVAGLGARLLALRSEVEGFYSPETASGELIELSKELERLKQERSQIDTQAARHAELAETLRTTRTRHEEAAATRTRLQARRDEIDRLLAARPWLGKLRALRELMAPLAELPEAPRGWQEALPALRETEIRLHTQLSASQEEVERLEYTAASINIDAAGCELAGQLDGAETLRTRYLAAEKVLPERRQRLAELDQAITFQLKQMEREGEAQPERLILPAATVERLRDLMEEYPAIVTAVTSAAEQVAESKQEVQALTQRLQEFVEATPAGGAAPNLLEHLRTALEGLRASHHAARRRQAEVASREAQEALSDALAALKPWRGPPDELLGMAAPEAASLERWKAAQDGLRRRHDQQRADLERLTDLCAQLSAQHDEAASQISDQQAAVIRVERDQAWAKLRSRLDAQSAALFEEQLRRDDALAAQRLADLAQFRATASQLAAARADLMQLERQHAQTLGEMDAMELEVRAALATLYPQLPANWTLPQLDGWLARRERALAARAAVQTAARLIKEADDEAKGLLRRLIHALHALQCPLPATPDESELTATAQAVLEGGAHIRSLQHALEQLQRESHARERAFGRAAHRKRQWEATWNQVCAGCWLAEGGSAPPLAKVRGVLANLSALYSALNERRALSERAGQLEEAVRQYEEFVLELAQVAGISREEGLPVMELVRRIEERCRQAQAGRARRAQETARLSAARDTARTLAGERQVHARHKQEMLTHLGVSTLAEGTARLAQIANRDRLRQEVATVEQQLLTLLRQVTLSEAEAALDGVDQLTLEKELAGITSRLQPLEQEWRDSYNAYRDAQRQIEAIGADAGVARLEEQRHTVLLAITEAVRQHVRLRAGMMTAEGALQLYREQHSSSMIAWASKALRVISRGTYTQLTTQQDDSGCEMLLAVAADQTSEVVTNLPQEGRFEVYLALRVAGYLELARSSPPVPFFADDIVDASDERWAGEALRLFTAMAVEGQVIYLTRHLHLCDIAREVCPTVQIHHLPNPGETPAAASPAPAPEPAAAAMP